MDMKRLYGLTCTGVKREGYKLILSRTPDLRPEDLVRIEWNMLKACPAPQLLPLEVEEIDRTLRLWYDCTSWKPLSEDLRFRPLKEEEFVRLLLQLASAANDCRSYMLSAHRIAWDPDFLFLSGDREAVRLLYLPLHALDEEEALAFRWGNIVKFLWSVVKDGTVGTARLVENILSEGREPGACLDLLRKHREETLHLSGADGCAKSTACPDADLTQGKWKIRFQVEEEELGPDSAARPDRDEEQKESLRTQSVSPVIRSVDSPVPGTSRKLDKAGPVSDGTAPTRSGHHRLAVALGASVLFGVWSVYAGNPVEEWLYVCLGVTLAAVFVLYAHLKASRNTQVVSSGDENGLVSDIETEVDPPFDLWPGAGGETGAAAYYRKLPDRTALLGNPDATVLLRPAQGGRPTAEDSLQNLGAAAEEPVCSAHLIATVDGEEEQLTLASGSFLIGRDEAAADYRIPRMEISRHHAEILKTGSGHAVRDLGSKNGTRLNEEDMVPFQEYLLTDGDEIRLADMRLIYRKTA